MNRRYTLLMASAAFAVATNSFAAIMLNVTQNADPAPGLESYTVEVLGTGGTAVSTLSGFELTGVHQVWNNAIAGADAIQTPNAGDTDGTFGNSAWGPADTHILSLADFNGSPGLGTEESNDGSNPAGIDLVPGNPAFAGFTGSAGLGGLRFVDENNSDNDLQAGLAFLSPQPQSVAFLQVVVPAGQSALMNLVAEDSEQQRTVFDGFEIGGGNDDPILAGDPASGSDLSAALQAAFDSRGDKFAPAIVPDAIMVMNENGELVDLGVIDVSDVTDNLPSIDVFLQPGSEDGKYDLVMDGPFDQLDQGTMIMGDIVITAENAIDQQLNYTFSAKIPEPSTVVLTSLAFVGLVGLARRRNG